MGKQGKRLADRYHAHVLRTPAEVRNAVHYVLKNHLKHCDSPLLGWADEFSSERYAPGEGPTVPPTSWLLSEPALVGDQCAWQAASCVAQFCITQVLQAAEPGLEQGPAPPSTTVQVGPAQVCSAWK